MYDYYLEKQVNDVERQHRERRAAMQRMAQSIVPETPGIRARLFNMLQKMFTDPGNRPRGSTTIRHQS